MTRVLMLQGTGSDVGKSVLVAGLCRAARRRGLRVVPFKPQNMSNNAAVAADGGEIGRAQALQARACGIAPSHHMNPVLLKPQTDRSAQVIVQGRPWRALDAADYIGRRDELLGAVLHSVQRLAVTADLILVEGAGSPAETNLRQRDIANMGFARAAGVPVVLVGDIDRGGVIASLVGTRAVLDDADAGHVVGFLINKFRGDPALFTEGLRDIVARTGWRSFGVVPWLVAAALLPAEDAVALQSASDVDERRRLKIVAPMLSRIANFDDADPLRQEPAVEFVFVPPGQPLPRDADVVLIPGTKSTLGDLAFLRLQGWDVDILAHARAGGRVLGLCGGYQLLGRCIQDPDGVDGPPGEAPGLGLLDVETVMAARKTVRPVSGRCALSGEMVAGYEIHCGRSRGPDCARPMLSVDGVPDGARSADGRVEGSYVHGLFAHDGFRRAWLERVRPGAASPLVYEAAVEAALDGLADGIEAAIDVGDLLATARPLGWQP